MRYTNGELKIDQLVSYLNEGKINLIPPFQRGRVWGAKLRSALLKNILDKKPIPAVFLYKEAAGSKYTYNILDGKQRIESIILFIKNCRRDLSIAKWQDYFFEKDKSKLKDFKVELGGKKKLFADVSSDVVRDLREYVIPTIEIDMGEDTGLQDIVSLFVDINQKGVKVEKFDIVKAIQREDPLLRYVFNLIAIDQKRRKDKYYKIKGTIFSRVLKRLSRVENMRPNDAKVNFMWEKMLELVIFSEKKAHRKPADILKMFVSGKITNKIQISQNAKKNLKKTFLFLDQAYKKGLYKTKLASDNTYFYTMVTAFLKDPNLIENNQILERLSNFADALQKDKHSDKEFEKKIKEFLSLSAKHTTDVGNREAREKLFLECI